MQNFDIIIVGAGPAGCKCADMLASAGKKVVLIEKDKIGGTCLNYGCIPSKSFLYIVELLENIKKSRKHGLEVSDFSVNWDAVKKKKDMNIKILSMGLRKNLESKGVTIIEGEAFLKSIEEILIKKNNGEEEEIRANTIVLSIGSKPLWLPFTEKGEHVISSSEILDLPVIPKTLAIVGGGIIGVEMASIFGGLGTEVTAIEKLDTLLVAVDREIASQLQKSLEKKNCKFHLKSELISVKDKNGQAELVYKNESGEIQTLYADKALVAIGRQPVYNISILEQLGIKNDGKRIILNKNLQSSVSNIYMIGDSSFNNLTAYGAEKEAEKVALHILGKKPEEIDYRQILVAVFSHPELAEIGINENEALKRNIKIEIKRSDYAANGKAVILGEREGMIKIILEKNTKKILGVSIIGVHATDLIHQALLPVKLGMTSDQWLEAIIWAHPVLSEIIKTALES